MHEPPDHTAATAPAPGAVQPTVGHPGPTPRTRAGRPRVARPTSAIAPLLPRPAAPPSPRGEAPDATVPGAGGARHAADGTTPGPPLPRLLSAAEVAAVFGRSARTVHDWAKRGRLVPVRVGRSLFFPEPDIRALLAGRLARRLPHR